VTKERQEKVLAGVEAYGIYLYVFFFFFDKGEGLRNIGMYGSFAAWTVLVFQGKRSVFPRNAIFLALCCYFFSAMISSAFSIESDYSFSTLLHDSYKIVIPFLVISTSFGLRRIMDLCILICIAGLIILVMGAHGLIVQGDGLYRSVNSFLTVDKNEYGFFLAFIMPFFWMFLLDSNGWKKRLWGVSSVWGMAATALAGSRGSMAAVAFEISLWAASGLRKIPWRKATIIGAATALAGVLTFPLWPQQLRNSVSTIPRSIVTMSDRTNFFWMPAIQAVQKRPLAGWGYGKMIYRDPRPFEGREKPHWELHGGLHSTFMTILFQQGIVGLLAYLFVLLSNVHVLLSVLQKRDDKGKALALALLSILVGAFIINSLVLVVPLQRLVLISAMSAALMKETCREVDRSVAVEIL
jgi:O-antigen ligase